MPLDFESRLLAYALQSRRFMAIASVVFQLDPDRIDDALRTLEQVPEVTLGERSGAYLAAIVESDSAESGAAACEQLRDLPGIAFLDVVMVDLRDEEQA